MTIRYKTSNGYGYKAKNKYFDTLEQASNYAEMVRIKTGDIVSVEAYKVKQ